MEARKLRHIKDGSRYDQLFPWAKGNNRTIRRFASVDDTVAFIPKVVRETLIQTEGIAKRLKGSDLYDTCKNIWHFVYDHINYRKDQNGYEQVRNPSRVWYDRREGVDCDCYSVFISSILTNLGIPHFLRITKYAKNYFQHIYPVVPHGSRSITIDCVTDQFDFEVPYSEKKDYPMDLQYLDGFGELSGETLGLFGKKKKKKAAEAASAAAVVAVAPTDTTAPTTAPFVSTAAPTTAPNVSTTPAPVPVVSTAPAPKPKKKGFLKKVVNVVNKVNPATLLLRNGVLAAMKLNIKNVAKRLRWSYLSPDKLTQHGIDPAQFQKLVTTRQKLENLFYGAGGKPENLKKAILNGKGNKDKAVSGLGMLPLMEWTGSMNEYTSLGELLGDEIYYSENVEGMEGFAGLGALGEPISLASIGAAMGVIAGIVSALKQIGSIFKKGSPGDADFDEALTDAAENNVNASAAASAAADSTAAANSVPVPAVAANLPVIPPDDGSSGDEEYPENYSSNNITQSIKTAATTSTPQNSNTPTDKQGFWAKNKTWLKPVAIGTGGLMLIAVGYKLVKGNKPAQKRLKAGGLSGLPRKRKKKTKGGRKKAGPKKAIALL